MAKETATAEKAIEKKSTAKIEVIVGREVILSTDKQKEALEKVTELQKENHPLIALVYHEKELTHLYKKDRYEKNYRATKGEYPYTLPKAVKKEAK